MGLEERLAMAQLLNGLLKQEDLIKFGNRKLDESLSKQLEDYVRKHMHNLLLMVMGEKTEESFTEEEVTILKAMVVKLKGAPR